MFHTPVRGRECLEALIDIEDHFLRAFESGNEVSKMLEANRVHLQSNFEEIKSASFISFSCYSLPLLVYSSLANVLDSGCSSSRNSGVTLSEVLPASSQSYAESGYPHHPSAETQTFPKTSMLDSRKEMAYMIL